MKPGSILKRAVLCGAALASAACAPVPMHWYVGDGAVGTLEYGPCAPTRGTPIGVVLERDGVRALVTTMQTYVKAPWVDVRFDVPEGRTLALQESVIRVDRRDGSPPLEGSIPNVSRVDTPHINSYNETPAIRQLMLPVDAPLVGGFIGRTGFIRHYWITAPIDTDGADDVWISVPSFTIDGVSTKLPAIHFQRKLIVAAVGNC